MQKKIFLIIGSVIVLVAALYFVIDYKNQRAVGDADNPYGTDDLEQATVDQLDDPDYQNQILPNELEEKLADGQDMVVYFYDPECSHCQELTPRLVPIAEDMDVDMKKFNLLEFEHGSDDYNIEGTPTLVYFEDGQEAERIEGAQSDETFRNFFQAYVVGDTQGSGGEQAS